MYAVVNNNIVTKIVSCAEQDKPARATEFPDDAQIHAGCDVRFFTGIGIRLTIEEAIAANLINPGANQSTVWEDGKYLVKDDYTNTEV